MIPYWRITRFTGALLLAVCLGLAPGCTLFDDYLPGTPFTPDQPVAEVTLEGEIYVSQASGNTGSCPAGGAFFWGSVRNTGDLDVDDVFITVEAYNGSDNLLGSFRVNVFNGEIITGTDPDAEDSFGTNLVVDQSGVFEVCTSLSPETVARTAYRTDFIVLDEIVTQ